MNILFNSPTTDQDSIKNTIKFLKEKKNLHGPGENYKKVCKLLSKKFRFKNVVLTNSCTSSLEISALSLNLKQNDEVIVPSFSFITTASSFARCGAKIVYCDIDKSNLMPSFDDICEKITKKTKAIAIIHYQGFSVEYLDKLKKLCKKKNISY